MSTTEDYRRATLPIADREPTVGYKYDAADPGRDFPPDRAPAPTGRRAERDHRPLQVRVEFTYDGGGLGQGGDVTPFVDGEQAGTGRVEATVPMIFSADETTDLGEDTGTSVSDDYEPHASSFNGRVRWVQIDIADAAENNDHLVSPEARLRIAMARQ